jgi:hypothetical protein
MLPTNDIVPNKDLLMVLKSYFDGGNQADSTQYDVVALASVSGTVSEWKPFERDWKGILKKHKVAYLHTTDAVARRGIYRGWDEKQRDAFLLDCVRVAGKHGARATIGEVPGKWGLFPTVAAFVLKDFNEHREENPDLPQNANEACLRQVLGEVLLWSQNQAACEHIHCFFDQGEPFYGVLCHLLQNKRALKDAVYLQKITSRTEADMRITPALQMADLYAWCVSHRLSAWKPKWQIKLLKTHWLGQWFDKSTLVASNIRPDQQAIYKSWNLPKRKPTR